MNLSPTPLRGGEGQKYFQFGTKNQGFKASSPVGERFGERFFASVEFTFNYDTNTLVGAQPCSLREIYMYQGFSEMVLAYGVTHTRSTDFRNGRDNHHSLIFAEKHCYQNNALKTQSSNHQ